jgi:hypothetical protein
MSRVCDAIGEIRAVIASVGSSVTEATATVAAVPKETSPEQTIGVLAPVQEKVAGVRDGVAVAIAKVEQTKQLTAAVLHGGQPGPMLAMLECIKQALALVVQRAGTAKQQVETAVAEARQVGAGETDRGWR